MELQTQEKLERANIAGNANYLGMHASPYDIELSES
jgi:hypothetical protein